MMEELLSQKEIDELFARYDGQPINKEAVDLLTQQELDTVGELGNICMGNAATTLSKLLNRRVTIGYPRTIVCRQDELFKSFLTPYLIIEVTFKNGLNGFNVLVISEEEVAAIADIMMGGQGNVKKPITIGELELSAATEAMNQMIGASATAMAELFRVPIDITPPVSTMVQDLVNADHNPLPTDRPVVVARFEISIGNLINTTFMQVTNVDAAREQTNFLLMQAGLFEPPIAQVNTANDYTKLPTNTNIPNLTGALKLPLDVMFSAGTNCWTVGDLAQLKVGDEIKLPGDGKEIDIMVNGVAVARGQITANSEKPMVKIVRVY